MRNPPQSWIILRTSGRSTLRLAATLAADGYEAWTPVREMRIRRPRWNVARQVRVPLMASFVFVPSCHLVDMMEKEERPGSEFSVFRYCDRIPLIADSDLNGLRNEETAPATPAELQGILRQGERVKATGGLFGGMAGVVERFDGALTLVRFGSRMRVKLSTFALEPIRSRAA